jgi:hypothetical protein
MMLMLLLKVAAMQATLQGCSETMLGERSKGMYEANVSLHTCSSWVLRAPGGGICRRDSVHRLQASMSSLQRSSRLLIVAMMRWSSVGRADVDST